MEERSFSRYAGREVTEGFMGVGPRQYRVVDSSELQDREVLGVEVRPADKWRTGSAVELSHWQLQPTITLAYDGTEYFGQLHAIELQVVGDSDEEFVAKHQQRELDEIHSW